MLLCSAMYTLVGDAQFYAISTVIVLLCVCLSKLSYYHEEEEVNHARECCVVSVTQPLDI